MPAAPAGIDPGALRAMTATCACLNARKVARLLSQLYDAALRPAGIRSTQLPLLATIGQRSPMTLTALADAVVIDRTTLTRSLALLTRKGWVRSSAGADLRTRQLRLTPGGWEVVRRAIPLWKKAQARVALVLGEPGTQRLLASFTTTVHDMTPPRPRATRGTNR